MVTTEDLSDTNSKQHAPQPKPGSKAATAVNNTVEKVVYSDATEEVRPGRAAQETQDMVPTSPGRENTPTGTPSGDHHADHHDKALRPKTLAQYIGQEKAREQIEVFVSAAKARAESLDHVLLFGPPGLGKTTLAHVIAHEMGAAIRTTSGPVLEKPKDLAALLTSLNAGDVLFIDEIHRLPTTVEEILYPALEDYRIDIMIGEGPAARSIQLDLQPFTLIGATTRAGMLTNPLRDRFGILCRLEFYTDDELGLIVERSAELLGCPVHADAAAEIARRSRMTPRIANRLLRRIRDYADMLNGGQVTRELADRALTRMEVNQHGLDRMDQLLLETVITRYAGGPVGLENLAASIGEESHTIEDVIEPYLIQRGLLQRTPRGRCATLSAYALMGLPVPAAAGVDAATGDLFTP